MMIEAINAMRKTPVFEEKKPLYGAKPKNIYKKSTKRADNKKRRVISICKYIESRKAYTFSADDLAAIFGVHKTTIMKDVIASPRLATGDSYGFRQRVRLVIND